MRTELAMEMLAFTLMNDEVNLACHINDSTENAAENFVLLVAMNYIMQGLGIGHAVLCKGKAGHENFQCLAVSPKYHQDG